MTQTFKNEMRELMKTAWQFAKRNGYTMSEAMTVAWRNYKLKKAMTTRIVRFWFQKIDGTLRDALGSLAESIIPQTQGSDRKANDTVQTYWDVEKNGWRSFKKANLLRVVI